MWPLPGRVKLELQFQPDSPRQRPHNLHETYQLQRVQLITPDDGHRRCLKHVDFYDKINFGYLMHLVGCFIRSQELLPRGLGDEGGNLPSRLLLVLRLQMSEPYHNAPCKSWRRIQDGHYLCLLHVIWSCFIICIQIDGIDRMFVIKNKLILRCKSNLIKIFLVSNCVIILRPIDFRAQKYIWKMELVGLVYAHHFSSN